MAGLRVIWPDAKPSEDVMKTVEDLRQKGNFTEEELERLRLYLMRWSTTGGTWQTRFCFTRTIRRPKRLVTVQPNKVVTVSPQKHHTASKST